MPSQEDVKFLLTAVKAKAIASDRAKQVFSALKSAEKQGRKMPAHEAALSLGLMDAAGVAKVQRMLATGGGNGTERARQIGRFKLVSKIGDGSTGPVHKAVDTATGRVVAVKLLSRELENRRVYLERFKREYTHAKQLKHPNIVGFVDAGRTPEEEGGHYYFAMEYIDGESLEEALRSGGRVSEAEVVQVAIGVTKALAHAHSLRIWHRDIKPGNIIISRDGAVKLRGLGLAKEESDSSVTQVGTVVGTPHYMSPEQARGMDLDERSDLYSLGATLFRLLTGQPPFDAKSPAVIMMKHLEEPAPSPQEVDPRITAEMCAVIAKMLAKEPRDRYANCHALLADLIQLQ